jgi:hypothetical protein
VSGEKGQIVCGYSGEKEIDLNERTGGKNWAEAAACGAGWWGGKNVFGMSQMQL